MITPSYSATATERVLPRMALDFTTGVLDSRVTVTRALNTATRVNSSGFIAAVNADLPRFDYDPVTLLPKGLLIEEARVNLCINSQNITSATFPNIGGTVTITGNTADVLSPAGDNTASKVDAATSSANVQNIVSASGSAYTMSIYVRPATSGNQIRFGWFDTLDRRVDFTLSGAGSYSGLLNATSASITAVGNSWYRITITATTSTTTPQARFLYPTAASINYFWGAQFEAGAFPTSYIPTTTTSLTRNADVVTMTGTNFTDWYNQAAGTFVMTYLETQNPIIAGGRMLSDTAQLRLPLYQVSTTQLGVYDPSTGGYGYNSGALVAGAVNRGATSWNSTTLYGCTNGGAVVSTAFDGNFDLSGLRIYSAHDNSTYKNGIVQKLAFYPQRLTNAELQAFTK